MNKELKPTKNPIVLKQTRSEDAIKITVTALLILAGTWMVLKISKGNAQGIGGYCIIGGTSKKNAK